jgi:hypothetical protein|tara:strand:- start:1830 stop:2114 length:285 start_codon:yes stop_codon:yes gene_type:complete
MTDSSSEEDGEEKEIIASLVGDVMQAKMEAVSAEGVHRLRLGVFEMEIVPDGEDVKPFMEDMVKLLHKLYKDEVLKARILHNEDKNSKRDAMIQ